MSAVGVVEATSASLMSSEMSSSRPVSGPIQWARVVEVSIRS